MPIAEQVRSEIGQSLEANEIAKVLRLQALDLASNFYHGSQSNRTQEVLHELTSDPENPWHTLHAMLDEDFLSRAQSNGFSISIPELYRDYREHIEREDTWFDTTPLFTQEQKKYLKEHPIASLSLEIAISKSLQTYSGGLGNLNGDVSRQESDMGIPLNNISLLYRQGYFRQSIREDGSQEEYYQDQEGHKFPMEEVVGSEGENLRIEIPMGDHNIQVRALKVMMGRNPVYLLDTNIEENTLDEDRWITGHLYGEAGGQETRIRQEIVLGVGGVKLLKALGKDPSILHLQEGHAAFASLEAMADLVDSGLSLDEARKKIYDKTAFTNHTVAVGDFFSKELVSKYLAPLAKRLGISIDNIYNLGADGEGRFSMTDLALRVSSMTNGVSNLHTEVLRKLYPQHKFEVITNGVHIETWLAGPMQALFDKHLGKNWRKESHKTEIFKGVQEIPSKEVWDAHQEQKRRLIQYLNKKYGCNLDPNILTVVSARRFAPYKRGGLLLSNMDEAAEIIGNDEMPVQVIFAGKAHPKDSAGKEIIKDLNRKIKDPRLKGRVVFISDYDMALAKLMVSGADLWMNTPRRKFEASGTSGMKSSINGVLQVTEIDGWADEVDWEDKGWTIGREEDDFLSMTHFEKEQVDERDGNELRKIFQREIAPMYYGNKKEWMRRMRRTMAEVATNYSTRRMKEEHVIKIYIPILQRQISIVQ